MEIQNMGIVNPEHGGVSMEESNEIKFKPQRQILIATDGSEASEKAADFGIETG